VYKLGGNTDITLIERLDLEETGMLDDASDYIRKEDPDLYNPSSRLKTCKSETNFASNDFLQQNSQTEIEISKSSKPKKMEKLENKRNWQIIKTYNSMG